MQLSAQQHSQCSDKSNQKWREETMKCVKEPVDSLMKSGAVSTNSSHVRHHQNTNLQSTKQRVYRTGGQDKVYFARFDHVIQTLIFPHLLHLPARYSFFYWFSKSLLLE